MQDPFLTGATFGIVVLACLLFGFWVVWDLSTSYTDRKIREAKKEMREYTRKKID